MRIARVVSLLVALLTAALVISPAAIAEEPLRLQTHITDSAGVLSSSETAQVQDALEKLYDAERIQVWVVYVNNFVNDAGQLISGQEWAESTAAVNNFGERDVMLAVGPTIGEYGLFVKNDSQISEARIDAILRDDVEPALHDGDWAGAPIALANGLDTSAVSGSSTGGGISWVVLLVILAVIVVAVVLLILWSRGRRRKRRAAELEAAKRVDPTDPSALAAVPIDALDDLSKVIVVDVDNAVRTSEAELALAVEEFGTARTEPFTTALNGAKTTLAQAFNVRQKLDDAVPESPQERRDLLTRVVVAAAKADRELDAQSDAFEELRDLVINAPTRLDLLTQQLVELTARLEPGAQALERLHQQYSETALSSVVGNVDAARERVKFADQNITAARALLTRPANDQTGLVDAVRTAESALGQARTLLDAVDSAASDINRAVGSLPAAIADTQRGVDAAAAQLQQKTAQAEELSTARDAAAKAVSDAQSNGSSDPLGTFTRLTKADADLDRLLASVAEERENAERMARALEQALFTAGSRVKAVSDFIDTRRGSIGPEARTRLAEATRQLEAANAKRDSNPNEAIAHANGAAMLAAQAQQLANNDVQAAQRQYTSSYGGGGSNMGGVLGGIIIGSILNGGSSSYGGSWSPGRSAGRPTSYGGSSRSSGRSYSRGGRF